MAEAVARSSRGQPRPWDPSPDEVQHRYEETVAQLDRGLAVFERRLAVDPAIEGEVDYSTLVAACHAALGSLTGRERHVLELRFGLEDGHDRTLNEVAQEFNESRERIRQVEARALRKLRHPSRSHGLKDFLE